MYRERSFTVNERCFFLILLGGFLVKYNFLLFRIFYIPSITGAVLRNMLIIVFFIFFVLPVIKTKKGRKSLYWLFFLFTIIFMANYWYNAYFGNYLSISDMIMGQGTGRFSIVEVLIRHILRPVDLLFLVDLLGISFFYRRSLSHSEGAQQEDVSTTKPSPKMEFGVTNFWSRIISKRKVRILLVFLLLFAQLLVTNTLLGSRNPRELYREGTSYFVNVYGLLPLYLAEISGYMVPERFIMEAEALPDRQKALDGQNMIPEDSNIIVIQWESLDEKMMNYEHQGYEVTPFMNQLQDDSLYFNNFYAQHVNGSFDADLSFLTSLYPVNRNYAYRENDLAKFDSLVKVLNDKDYQTLAFHNNDRDFFHRDQAFAELGFDRFYALDDYSFEDCVMEVERFSLGINDYDFFKQSLELLEKAEEPFFGFFITVTSHTPFDFYPLSQKREEFTDIENTLVQDFFHSLSFTDSAVEMFIDELEARGLLEDTLLVIYSDHEAALEEEEYTSASHFKVDRNVKKPHHIPLLFKHPHLESGTIENTGTLTDLAPTILDIIGEEKLPGEFVGRSLLAEQEQPVLFLHETPQVLYRDQLFVMEQEEFERIGFREETGKSEVDISPEKKDDILQIIRFMRNSVFSRRRE